MQVFSLKCLLITKIHLLRNKLRHDNKLAVIACYSILEYANKMETQMSEANFRTYNSRTSILNLAVLKGRKIVNLFHFAELATPFTEYRVTLVLRFYNF